MLNLAWIIKSFSNEGLRCGTDGGSGRRVTSETEPEQNRSPATKLAYRIQSVIDYDSLSFNPDDPEPLPDAMYQYPVFEEILSLCRQDEMLKFYNHETGAYLRTLPQSEAALSVERVARQSVPAGRC